MDVRLTFSGFRLDVYLVFGGSSMFGRSSLDFRWDVYGCPLDILWIHIGFVFYCRWDFDVRYIFVDVRLMFDGCPLDIPWTSDGLFLDSRWIFNVG